MNRLQHNIPALLSLLRIAEHGSINKAAALLNISQPALTRNIAKLERIVGAVLLDRSPKGVALTPFGTMLINRARTIEAELRGIQREIDAVKGMASGVVALGATPLVLAHFLPVALEMLHRDFPLVLLRVTEGSRPSLLAMLRLGDLDVVVSTMPNEPESELEHEGLFELDLRVVVRPKHPLAKRTDLTLKHLSQYRWALPRADSAFHKRLERDFKRAGAALPHSSIEIASPQATKVLIASTDLLAILPTETVSSEINQGHLIDLRGDWELERRTVAAFFRKGTTRPVATEKLVEYVKRKQSRRKA